MAMVSGEGARLGEQRPSCSGERLALDDGDTDLLPGETEAFWMMVILGLAAPPRWWG